VKKKQKGLEIIKAKKENQGKGKARKKGRRK